MGARLVATVLARDAAAASPLLTEPPTGTDFVELRLDALAEPSPQAVKQLLALPRTAPVIATCRSHTQGGLAELEDAARLALLATAGECGADILDVEDGLLDELPPSVPGERLASCHVSRFLPRLEALAKRLVERGADFAKLAVPVDNPRQLAQLLDVQQQFAGQLAVVPTGRLAEAGRVLAAGRGATLCYGAASAEHRGHPDQPLAERLHDLFTVSMLNDKTRFFAVVGRPIAHSLSPAYHNTVFRGVARNARMVTLDVDNLADVMKQVDALRLDGLAVTHPFKQEAIELAHSVLPGARSTGSANTLVRTPAGWQARNTDWKAACDLMPRLLKGLGRRAPGATRDWLAPVLSACWKGLSGGRKPSAGSGPLRVLLLGAGGAARAVAVALLDQDVELQIWNRRLGRARQLASDLSAELPATPISDPSHGPGDLVINATPVGMPGIDDGDLSILEASAFRPDAVAVDLTYGGPDSPFRTAAREAGARLVPGEFFFGLQARRQAEVFIGADLPVELRSAAAERCGIVV